MLLKNVFQLCLLSHSPTIHRILSVTVYDIVQTNLFDVQERKQRQCPIQHEPQLLGVALCHFHRFLRGQPDANDILFEA